MAGKLYPLPLKHHKSVKEKIRNLFEDGLIECTRSPYDTPVIVVPRKSNPGAPLAETKWLAIDYRGLNKQIRKVQTIQVKSKGSLALNKTTKIDHIWSKLRGAKYLTILWIRSWYHHISIHPRVKTKNCIYLFLWETPMEVSRLQSTDNPKGFSTSCLSHSLRT